MKQTDLIKEYSTLGTEKFANRNKADLDHLESDEVSGRYGCPKSCQ